MNSNLKFLLTLPLIPFFMTACGNNTKTEGKPQEEPYYKYAWHFNENNKITAVDSQAHINIEKVWEKTRGKYQVGKNIGTAVKVAVIDDNFNENHEEFKNNIIAKCDFDNFEKEFTVNNYKKEIIEHCKINNDVNPKDKIISHGTTVASFIASQVNSKGLVGSAPHSNLILIKQSNQSVGQTIAAFEYAKMMGAKVINCSWGTKEVSSAVTNKIKELEQEGIHIVFASGNEGENLDLPKINDESELPYALGVGATNNKNKIASYSNYGSNIDVLAPGGGTIDNGGVGILGAYVPNKDPDAQAQTHKTEIDIKNYSFDTGTSFSAPITSGVIALMISVNPDLSPAEVRKILIETTDKVGEGIYLDRENDNTTSTFNEKGAYGKIHALKAVTKASQLYKKDK